MHKIDESFRQKKDADARKRRQRQIRRRACALLAISIASLLIATAFFLFYEKGIQTSSQRPAAEVPEPLPAYASMILEIPGDPLRLEIGGEGLQSSVKEQLTPEALRQLGLPDKVSIVREPIILASQKLMTAIPSTPEDFTYFQAQKATPSAAQASSSESVDVPPDTSEAELAPGETTTASAPNNGGWSDIDDANLEGSDGRFQKTDITDNTSTILLIANRFRQPRREDDLRRVLSETPAEDFLIGNGVVAAKAVTIAGQFKAAMGSDVLHSGAVVALRYLRDKGEAPGDRRLVQIAFYQEGQFQAAFALNDDGALVGAADPWVDTDLLKSLDSTAADGTDRRFRLLDGIYSVGLRNRIESSVIGEAIMYLSRGHDLGEFAATGDELTLVYSSNGRETPAGQNRVFYAGIEGKNVTIHCFVFLPSDGKELACFEPGGTSGTVEVANGMITPVAGVMSSTFGPRRHPILGKILMHDGVDWAAPVGTPVRAAYAGRVSFSGEKGTFGNFIQIDQDGGRAEGYAHLNGFAPGIVPGKVVAAGDLIGFVGATGRSTGPHLHFEVYENGKPVDPMRTSTAANDSGLDAVDVLVDRIVHVESGGAADIKNPLSTATGLGQFIESTWVRMMKTYRPDLSQSLDRDSLLALRSDPTLSREMIANLARENKADLEAAGQVATAGRLYLAHFLGSQGAILVLQSDDNSPLDTLLGSSVMRANPFLTGRGVGFVKGWADQMMRSSNRVSRPPELPKPQLAPPAFLSFKAAIESVIGNAPS